MKLIALKLSVTRDYLFSNGRGGYVLVDTGYAEDWELFRRRLGEAGVSIADISHLILTHHHDDHVGLIHPLLRQKPGIIVVMSAATRELLLAGRNDTSHGGALLNRRVAFLLGLKQTYVSLVTGRKTEAGNKLRFEAFVAREGDIVFSNSLRLADIGIEAGGLLFPSPGHSIDSVSLLFDDGDCLVGDAAANFLVLAGTRNCVVFVRDLAEYYATWEDILSRGAKTILPAHGRPFPSERLRRNLGRNKAGRMVPLP